MEDHLLMRTATDFSFRAAAQVCILRNSAKLLVSCHAQNQPKRRRSAQRGKVRREDLHDKQSERDHRELRIDKVGVRGLRFPIQVRDKAHSVQNTVATIGMFVDLPKEFKGTHMSRFIEVLNAHGNVIHVENITDILRVDAEEIERRHVAPGNRVSRISWSSGRRCRAGKA